MVNDNQEVDIQLDNEQYVKYLINYLDILQKGRVKPNSSKEAQVPVIYDSIDNLPDIKGVKNRLNFIFSIIPIHN